MNRTLTYILRPEDNAVTHYEVLKREKGHSLVSFHLETGRTHQIRIHMKHIGYPLIGDYLYNPDMRLIHRQALHSYQKETINCILNRSSPNTAWGTSFGMINVSPSLRINTSPPTVNLPVPSSTVTIASPPAA